jgi:hypothetical protein
MGVSEGGLLRYGKLPIFFQQGMGVSEELQANAVPIEVQAKAVPIEVLGYCYIPRLLLC